MQDDVADAVDWAAAKGVVNGARVCIAGGSYGGYSTLMSLCAFPTNTAAARPGPPSPTRS
ncbi:MAG: prolyl oligopeptidase family serine peptidase, partial [Caldimonas sp.]